MLYSIRWRIAFPYVALVLISMVSLGLYLSDLLRRNYEKDLQNQLVTAAQLIADNLAASPMTSEAGTELDPLVHEYAQLMHVRLTIIAADGTVLTDSQSDRSTMGNHLDRPEVQAAMQTGQGSSIRMSETEGYEMMYIAAPITTEERVTGVVRVALPLQEVSDAERYLRLTVLPATLFLTLGGIVVALLVAERVATPVRRLADAAQALAQGKLDEATITRLRTNVGRDELSVLTRIFGEMADQVRVREQMMQQQMQALRIEVDLAKKAQQVSEITETDTFRDLQERARTMRSRHKNTPNEG